MGPVISLRLSCFFLQVHRLVEWRLFIDKPAVSSPQDKVEESKNLEITDDINNKQSIFLNEKVKIQYSGTYSMWIHWWKHDLHY